MLKKKFVLVLALSVIMWGIALPSGHAQTKHSLLGTPKTVHWGYFSAAVKPVLKIESGDTVVLDSPHGSPFDYEAGGVPKAQIPKALWDIYKEIEVKDRGPGPHILTGPIYVNGAEIGDVLAVHIKDVRVTAPFGYNANKYGRGTIPEDFPYDNLRILWMDLNKKTTEPLPGVVVPLNPFFGTMGVAPPPGMGKISSSPPNIHGGNMDNKELIAGAILYLPVHVKGALFSAGDAHAVQGDGEVNVNALEAEMEGTFQFFVEKGRRLKYPRAETATHFITMGFHEDLDTAAKMALQDMIAYLGEEKGINPTEAYRLSSLAVDLHVTQLVNGNKGVHAMLPKSLFVNK